MTKPKCKILKTIRKSVLTGKAIWVSHDRSYRAEYYAYKRACRKEAMRINHWACTVARRKKNIIRLLGELTSRLPILGDTTHEQRAASKVLSQLVDDTPQKQSDFYDHICEERRQKNNTKKREKRWQQKYGKKKLNHNYDKRNK